MRSKTDIQNFKLITLITCLEWAIDIYMRLGLYEEEKKINQWKIDALTQVIDSSDIRYLFDAESSGIKKRNYMLFVNVFIILDWLTQEIIQQNLMNEKKKCMKIKYQKA